MYFLLFFFLKVQRYEKKWNLQEKGAFFFPPL